MSILMDSQVSEKGDDLNYKTINNIFTALSVETHSSIF